MSDGDARSSGSAHPRAHLWDNGNDPSDELARLMDVRKHLLDQFSEQNLAFGRPLALLEETLAPIYMFHRYQIAAASKVLGGLYYDYAIRDGRGHATFLVEPEEQRRALKLLLKTIEPEALALPEHIIAMIPPHTTGYRKSRENFGRRTGATFDPLSAAESVADLTVRLILNPDRAARLVEHHARDKSQPGLREVIDRLLDASVRNKKPDGLHGEIGRLVDDIILRRLFDLAANDNTSAQARAITHAQLDELAGWIELHLSEVSDHAQKSHLRYAASQIRLFQIDPNDFDSGTPIISPDGSPIGIDAGDAGRLGCGWH